MPGTSREPRGGKYRDDGVEGRKREIFPKDPRVKASPPCLVSRLVRRRDIRWIRVRAHRGACYSFGLQLVIHVEKYRRALRSRDENDNESERCYTEPGGERVETRWGRAGTVSFDASRSTRRFGTKRAGESV